MLHTCLAIIATGVMLALQGLFFWMAKGTAESLLFAYRVRSTIYSGAAWRLVRANLRDTLICVVVAAGCFVGLLWLLQICSRLSA